MVERAWRLSNHLSTPPELPGFWSSGGWIDGMFRTH
jgi:hypothetical protein